MKSGEFWVIPPNISSQPQVYYSFISLGENDGSWYAIGNIEYRVSNGQSTRTGRVLESVMRFRLTTTTVNREFGYGQ